jgi:hypothetical protein
MDAKQQQIAVDRLTEIRRLAAVQLGDLGVAVLDGATQEGMLRSEINEMTLLFNKIGTILGHTGPARTLPDHAKTIMARIK